MPRRTRLLRNPESGSCRVASAPTQFRRSFAILHGHKSGRVEGLARVFSVRDSALRRRTRRQSAAAIWAPLARFIEGEARLGHWAGKRRVTAFIYEFLRFGVKQAWA